MVSACRQKAKTLCFCFNLHPRLHPQLIFFEVTKSNPGEMADTDGAEGDHDPEAPEEDLSEQEVLQHFGKFSEARQAIPWEQWTFKEKTNFYMDRIFLSFLVIFVLVLLGECGYKMWYVSNLNKTAAFVSDSAIFLFNWLFTQEKQEELFEL